MADPTGQDRRDVLCDWLRANGIDPTTVPHHAGTLDLAFGLDLTDPPTLTYTAYVCGHDGRRVLAPGQDEPMTEHRTVELRVAPPLTTA